MQSSDLFARAIAAFQSRRFEDAEKDFKKFLRREPRHFGALNLYSVILTQAGRYAEAESFLREAIRVNPQSDTTLYNYGLVLKHLNKTEQAFDAFSKSIAINPAAPETWNNRGTVLNELERYGEAISDFDRALALSARYPDALYNKGKSLLLSGRTGDALSAFEQALRIKPDFPEALIGAGHIHYNNAAYDQALLAYDRAIALAPNLDTAWTGRALTLSALGRHQEAIAASNRVAGEPDSIELAKAVRVHSKTNICDWNGIEAEFASCIDDIRNGSTNILPFFALAIPTSPAEQRESATNFLRKAFWRGASPLWQGEIYAHERIKVAYLSGDFRDHPVSHLIAGLLEHHDRNRFETFGISISPPDSSPIRQRIGNAFEHFHDVHGRNDADVARLLHELQIDIVIDLIGYTQGMRPAILAERPAPVQVNYLGYPGTMGTAHRDYLIADSTVIPEEDRQFYSEQVVYLPDCYLPNDDTRAIAEQTPSRAEEGLPEQGFVFCGFNSPFKISPEIFDVWMRLLGAVEGSVLWLRGMKDQAPDNLRRQAEARGIAGERIVFARRAERMEDHLARHRLADLFLDTVNYNAHTSACDALWAGLPLITCIGTTFAGRVGASVLKAAGLPDLVTTSLADYEALALKLAHEPDTLAAIKARLAGQRPIAPLFDTARFTRQIEAAYAAMWQRYQNGEPPQAFAVERLG